MSKGQTEYRVLRHTGQLSVSFDQTWQKLLFMPLSCLSEIFIDFHDRPQRQAYVKAGAVQGLTPNYYLLRLLPMFTLMTYVYIWGKRMKRCMMKAYVEALAEAAAFASRLECIHLSAVYLIDLSPPGVSIRPLLYALLSSLKITYLQHC